MSSKPCPSLSFFLNASLLSLECSFPVSSKIFPKFSLIFLLFYECLCLASCFTGRAHPVNKKSELSLKYCYAIENSWELGVLFTSIFYQLLQLKAYIYITSSGEIGHLYIIFCYLLILFSFLHY